MIELKKEKNVMDEINVVIVGNIAYDINTFPKRNIGTENNIVSYEEINILIKNALTDKTNDREVYMKGIDTSYKYEGYNNYTMDELDK